METRSRIPAFVSITIALALLIGSVGMVGPARAAVRSGVEGAIGCPAEVLSYWRLDETGSPTVFYDSQDGNDATCSGSDCPQPIPDGKIGGAQDFDGSKDRLETGNAANPTSEMTAMAWVNPNSLTNIDKGIFFKAGVFYLELESDNNFMVDFSVIVGGQLVEFAPAGSGTPIGQWTHIAGTYDGTYVKVYMNGARVPGTMKKVGAIDSDNNPFIIGYSFKESQDRYFDGKIDEVAIFDRALTANEIGRIYHSGIAKPVCNYSNVMPLVLQ